MNKEASFLSPEFMVVAFGHFPRRESVLFIALEIS